MKPTIQSYKAAEAAAERILRDLAEVTALYPHMAGVMAVRAECMRLAALDMIRRYEA